MKRVRVVGHWSGAILTDEDGLSVEIEEGTLLYADVAIDDEEWERLKAAGRSWSSVAAEAQPGEPD